MEPPDTNRPTPPQTSSAPKMLLDKYEKLCKIGEGSYGVVFKCRNKDSGQLVAIKKFMETDDDPAIKKIAMREIRMLRQLKHPNLVNLIEVFKRNRKLHLVFEHCDRTVLDDLEKFPNGCPDPLIKSVMYQLLHALSYCHSKQVIHRDIKPENILLTTKDEVKLGDFGFARILNTNELLTDYVATRWYRSVELLVGDLQYGSPTDIWGLGCVMAEMTNGEPLWPGRTDLDQLFLIKQTMGDILSRHVQIFRSNQFFRGMTIPEPQERVDLRQKLPQASPTTIDFLLKCFDPNPELRFSASELLQHEYFQGYQYRSPEENTTPLKKYTTTSHLPQLGIEQKRQPPNYLPHQKHLNLEQHRSYLPTLI